MRAPAAVSFVAYVRRRAFRRPLSKALAVVAAALGRRHRAIDGAASDDASHRAGSSAEKAATEHVATDHRTCDASNDLPGRCRRMAAIFVIVARVAVIMMPGPRFDRNRNAC